MCTLSSTNLHIFDLSWTSQSPNQRDDEKELLSSTYLSRKAARGASASENKAFIAGQLAIAKRAEIEDKKKAGLAVAAEFASSESRKEYLREFRKIKAAKLKAEKSKSTGRHLKFITACLISHL